MKWVDLVREARDNPIAQMIVAKVDAGELGREEALIAGLLALQVAHKGLNDQILALVKSGRVSAEEVLVEGFILSTRANEALGKLLLDLLMRSPRLPGLER